MKLKRVNRILFFFVALQLAACGASAGVTKQDVLTAYKDKFRHMKSWRVKYRVTSRELYEGRYRDTVELRQFYGRGKKRGKVRPLLDVDGDSVKLHFKTVYNGWTERRLSHKQDVSEGVVSRISGDALLARGSTSPLGYAGLYKARRGRWWQLPPRIPIMRHDGSDESVREQDSP